MVDRIAQWVEPHAGDVAAGAKPEPLLRGARLEDRRQRGIRLLVVPGALRVGGEVRIRRDVAGTADRPEKRFPLLVVVDQRADIAVLGLEGSPVQEPAVPGRTLGWIEAASAHVIVEDELRQRLEHGQLDLLRLAGALP